MQAEREYVRLLGSDKTSEKYSETILEIGYGIACRLSG